MSCRGHTDSDCQSWESTWKEGREGGKGGKGGRNPSFPGELQASDREIHFLPGWLQSPSGPASLPLSCIADQEPREEVL